MAKNRKTLQRRYFISSQHTVNSPQFVSKPGNKRSKSQPSHSNLDKSQEVKEVIYINDNSGGPLIAGRVFDEPSHMFLDTGAFINLINLDFLRKAKPGLVIIEPTTFNIHGVTGNKLTPVGETQITVTFGNYYMLELTGVMVEQQAFPGNLLIGYDTMRDDYLPCER